MNKLLFFLISLLVSSCSEQNDTQEVYADYESLDFKNVRQIRFYQTPNKDYWAEKTMIGKGFKSWHISNPIEIKKFLDLFRGRVKKIGGTPKPIKGTWAIIIEDDKKKAILTIGIGYHNGSEISYGVQSLVKKWIVRDTDNLIYKLHNP